MRLQAPNSPRAADSGLVSCAVQMQKQLGRRSRGSGTTPAIAESHQMKPTWKFTGQRGRAKSSTPEKVPSRLELITHSPVQKWPDEPPWLA